MMWFAGFMAGLALGLSLMVLAIIIGVRKIDKLNDELDNLSK